MSFALATPPAVILGLVPRTQISTSSAVAGGYKWLHRAPVKSIQLAARWVLGTSPRMTFERNALFSDGATP
jgi:hypothetical protein